MKKVGILGGTFDPIHRAHMALARVAKEQFELDEIIIMPSGNSYLKTINSHVTDSVYRLRMAELAAAYMNADEASVDTYRVSDMEIRRQGYTYTGDTLLQLSREYSDTEWYFIIGADSLKGMKSWYAPEVIFHCAHVIVGNRNDQVPVKELLAQKHWLQERYHGQIHLMPFASMDVSSSEIRGAIYETGCCPDTLIPSVASYIEEHHLYHKPYTKEEILADLGKRMKPSRLTHTRGVAETARKMAENYGTVDPDRAELAGWIHDCGKNEGTALTHGPVGARIARNEYGITDSEILSAVYCHTTGKPGMTDLEKIVFIADYIEPNRDQAPHLEELRELAMKDLNRTTLWILQDTLEYLRSTNTLIDPRTMETCEYYQQIVNESLKNDSGCFRME